MSRQCNNTVDKTRIKTDKTTKNRSRTQDTKAGANHIIVVAKNESLMNGSRFGDIIIRETETEKESLEYLESNLSEAAATARADIKNKYPHEKQKRGNHLMTKYCVSCEITFCSEGRD